MQCIASLTPEVQKYQAAKVKLAVAGCTSLDQTPTVVLQCTGSLFVRILCVTHEGAACFKPVQTEFWHLHATLKLASMIEPQSAR